MTNTIGAIRAVLLRELDAFAREVDAYPDDETAWRTVPGVANSCGNLALHVTGNLQHYVGTVLGGTAYVRNREAEFGRRAGSRTALIGQLREAREVVATVLERLPESAWSEPYPEVVGGAQLTKGVFLVHLATHLALHLGQAGYLRRMLAGEPRSTAPVSIRALADQLAPPATPSDRPPGPPAASRITAGYTTQPAAAVSRGPIAGPLNAR